ncbi:dihydropteroate synthase [Croceibacterium ferulae]|uniref:dihydropteroate synthase n=1 Tax=Croceibacterium ferulae TaxID=1854641 RepID=UPI000EACE7D7|nr:dihydropteroate synthase [Croceibacterium ferulae]
MSGNARVYVQPLTSAPSPQALDGDAVRLAGGMAWAHAFAVIVTEDGRVTRRDVATPTSIAATLARLPTDLMAEGEAQWANLTRPRAPLATRGGTLRLDEPQVMGILNVTPDSFSDGGRHIADPAEHVRAMLEAGATIIDVGGESTRPGADPVWEGDEIARIVPAVEACRQLGALISLDTRRAAVMEAGLAAGAHVINDVSALYDDAYATQVVAAAGVPVVLMHAPGAGGGGGLHAGGDYTNILFDVFDWLRAARDRAVAAGISPDRIMLDPGIGFGKPLAGNLALLNGLALFHALGHPVLVGASRKRMIGALHAEAPAGARLGGSVALALAAMQAGCQIVRVHDVWDTVQARNVWRALRDGALSDVSGLPVP